jgi:hypothetical protein
MQVNRVGIGLIGFFLLAGLGLVVVPTLFGASGEVAAIVGLTGAIWIVVALGLVLYSRRQKKKGAHQDWVFQNGIRGRATVVDVSSHAEVNGMPLIKLKLELDVPGQGARRAQRREIMPVFSARRMEEGLVLPVYVNPQDADDFVLVW